MINPKGAQAPEVLDGMTWELIPGVGRVSPEISEAQGTRYASLGFHPYGAEDKAEEPEERPVPPQPPAIPATIAPRPPPKPAPSHPKTVSKSAKKKKSTRRGR